MEKEQQKLSKTKERYVDQEGFERKTREGIGIVLWFIAGIITRISWGLPDDMIVISLLLWPLTAYLCYMAIKKYSSHSIETWHQKHVSAWIFGGCLLTGLAGIIIYYVLKSKERKYLLSTKSYTLAS